MFPARTFFAHDDSRTCTFVVLVGLEVDPLTADGAYARKMDEDLSMGEADFERITAALAAKKVRVTINVLPDAAASKDHEVANELAADRLARHELGIRGIWVHDVKDMNSTHSLEQFGADPDQQRRLIASGAVWVGPRHLAPH